MRILLFLLAISLTISTNAQRSKCPSGPIDTIQCTVRIGAQEWSGVGAKPAPHEIQAWAIVQKDSCRRGNNGGLEEGALYKTYEVFGIYSDPKCTDKLPRGSRAFKNQP